jgi:hypothetical protein
MQNAKCEQRPFAATFFIFNLAFCIGKNARVTTADAEQITVAAFLPWRGS